MRSPLMFLLGDGGLRMTTGALWTDSARHQRAPPEMPPTNGTDCHLIREFVYGHKSKGISFGSRLSEVAVKIIK
jgi:hypothetical protein